MYLGRRGQQGVPWRKGDVCNEKWKRNGTRTGRESNNNDRLTAFDPGQPG